MEILLYLFGGVLCIAPPILFVFYCFDLIDNNKNEDGFNRYNSSLGVQCNAKEKCDWRFSSMCTSCKHNCGMKEDKFAMNQIRLEVKI